MNDFTKTIHIPLICNMALSDGTDVFYDTLASRILFRTSEGIPFIDHAQCFASPVGMAFKKADQICARPFLVYTERAFDSNNVEVLFSLKSSLHWILLRAGRCDKNHAWYYIRYGRRKPLETRLGCTRCEVHLPIERLPPPLLATGIITM